MSPLNAQYYSPSHEIQSTKSMLGNSKTELNNLMRKKASLVIMKKYIVGLLFFSFSPSIVFLQFAEGENF